MNVSECKDNPISLSENNKLKASLRSQQMRSIAAEMDSLKIGSGWSLEDLDKPQVMVQSSWGDSHPGSVHLGKLTGKIKAAIEERGGKPAQYTVTDICDGIAQGHDGMNYSLVSRELLTLLYLLHHVIRLFLRIS